MHNYIILATLYVHLILFVIVIAMKVGDFQVMELLKVVQPMAHLFSVLLPT